MERGHIRLRRPPGGPQAWTGVDRGGQGGRALGRAYGLVQGSAPHIPAPDSGCAAVQVCTQAPGSIPSPAAESCCGHEKVTPRLLGTLGNLSVLSGKVDITVPVCAGAGLGLSRGNAAVERA